MSERISYMAWRLFGVLTHEPLGAGEIMLLTGIKTKAQLRLLVHELRLAGYMVCSRTENGGGYWLGNEADRARTVADLKSRRNKISEVITALERGPLDGQEVIEL